MKVSDSQNASQGNLDFNQSPVIKSIPESIISNKDNNRMEFSVFNYPSVRLPFTFHSSKEVYESMKEYQKSDREMFLILFLDSKNNVLNIEPHTIGTIDSCAVYPREVFKSALLNSANSIICVHHHPSGDSEPSESDRQLTKELVLGGKFLGIKVLDHIILGKNQYFSFADIGLMEEYESSLIEYK